MAADDSFKWNKAIQKMHCYEQKDRYFCHPESCCVWVIPNCTEEQFNIEWSHNDGNLCEIAKEDYLRLKEEYK